MIDDVLTVEQVAQLLGLHPKTVRGFIADGKLRARKLGKGWRIMRRDFETLIAGTEEPGTQSGDGSEARHDETGAASVQPDMVDEDRAPLFRVSTVIDAYVNGREEADRLSSSVLAAASSKDPSHGDVRVDYIYYESERKARFVLYGSASFIGELLMMLAKIR
jgi:excisionase family DNA binding protein